MVKGGEYWRISDIRRQPPYLVDQVEWPGNYPRSINQYWRLGKLSAELEVLYRSLRFNTVTMLNDQYHFLIFRC